MNTAYWTYSELVLSFICACVPTFRPVFNHFAHGFNSILQGTSWRRTSRNSSYDVGERGLVKFNSKGLAREVPRKGSDTMALEDIEDPNTYEATAYSGKDAQAHDVETGGSSQGIHVQTDFRQST